MSGAHDYGGYRASGAGGVPDHLLPRLIETVWDGGLPLKAERERPALYQEFRRPDGQPVAVIWYREDDDTVAVHIALAITNAVRAQVNERVRQLRIQIARQA